MLESAPGDESLSPTLVLARFAANLAYADLDDAEKAALRRHLIDTLGAWIAGARSEVFERTAKVLVDLGTGDDILTAAYLGGVAVHSLELDDGHRRGAVHPGATVVPALAALAARRPISGRSFMSAMAVGYETTIRLAAALHPNSRRRGFHNTSVAGVMGAAVAASAAQGANASTIASALGLAASSAAGLWAFLEGGGDVKQLHPGAAARDGVLAASLAIAGVAGPERVIEGNDGFLKAFAGVDAAASLVEGLGLDRARLQVTQGYLKPYASCRHIHPAIDAALTLRTVMNAAPEAIARVEVETYSIAASHAVNTFNTIAEAQRAYPFCLASALRFGPVTLDQFTPQALNDPQTLALCQRIEIKANKAYDAIYPAFRPARVKIWLQDGRQFEEFVQTPLGEPDNPLSDEQLRDKFMMLADPVLGTGDAQALLRLCLELDDLGSMEPLLRLLRSARQSR
jgi:2-methylcitrate dehydratase PrpD